MKKNALKVSFIAAMSFFLSACSLLPTANSKKSNVTKMASYKKEVTVVDFATDLYKSKMISILSDSNYKLKDFVAECGLDFEVSESIRNNKYAQSERSKAEAKGSASVSTAFDVDTDILTLNAKDNMSFEMTNTMLGETKASHKGEWNFQLQHGSTGYFYDLVNVDDKTFYDIHMEVDTLGGVIEEGLKTVPYMAEQLYTLVEQNRDEIEQYINALGLKFYVDGDVYTVTGSYRTYSDLYDYMRVYDPNTGDYYEIPEYYGSGLLTLNFVAQVKIAKSTQVRLELSGSMIAEFTKNHNPLLGGLFSLFDVATKTCVEGDKEDIFFESAFGVNLEQKKVENQQIDLSSYTLLY